MISYFSIKKRDGAVEPGISTYTKKKDMAALPTEFKS